MSNRFGDGGQQDVQEYFDERYETVLSPVMLSIEKEVTGTDVGATSWSSPAQVEAMIDRLDLEPGVTHLDIGSGSGWPALHIAEVTGARVIMSDLPFTGLAQGIVRARSEGLNVDAVQASGTLLPFADSSFESISHSDVLCCLAEKEEVLAECRRLISPPGTMAFTVICLNESRTADDLDALGPSNELVASESPYPAMLQRAGFVSEQFNMSEAFLDSAKRVLQARTRHYAGLVELLDQTNADEMLERSETNVRGISNGVLERHMYICKPAG